MIAHAVVLLKPILDPELPAARFRVGDDGVRPAPGLAGEVLGPFEQSALELALQLREAGHVERLTALAAGTGSAVELLRKALAVRADDATLVRLPETVHPDAAQTIEILARAIERLGDVGLVVAGRQAGDWDQAQVGYGVAERLRLPCVGLVTHATCAGGELVVERTATDGVEVVAVRPPAAVTVTNHDANRLRMAKVMDLMAANRKPIDEVSIAELGLGDDALEGCRAVDVVALTVASQERICQMVEGDDARDVAARLLARLAERQITVDSGA